MMKRIFAGTVAALLAAVLFLPQKTLALSAGSACVVDSVTGRMLYEHFPSKRSLIASTTKIMTALVVCEQTNVLDKMRIPEEAVGIEGSSMYLREGEVLTVQELLYGLMLSSGNDAAVALAIYCGGTVEGFVAMMNDKARLLGLKDTHFENPHGLDAPEHYSTAADLATLAAYAMENPIFRKTVSAKTVTLGERTLRNHNKLLWMIDGADGVKTGYTRAAGRILVSSATRNDRRLIAVTLDDPNDWQDHQQLLENGFSSFHVKHIVREGDCLGMLEVLGGTAATVCVYAAEDFCYSVSDEETPLTVLPGPGFVYAPVAENEDAGFAYVVIAGKAVGKIPLKYADTVEKIQETPESFFGKLFGDERYERKTSENTVIPGCCFPEAQ